MADTYTIERIADASRSLMREPGLDFRRSRTLKAASLLSRHIRIVDTECTRWVDIGGYLSILDTDMRWYARIKETQERDGKRAPFIPLNYVDLALADEAEEADAGSIAIEKGYGFKSFGEPYFLTDSVEIGLPEVPVSNSQAQDGELFVEAIHDFAAIVRNEPMSGTPRSV